MREPKAASVQNKKRTSWPAAGTNGLAKRGVSTRIPSEGELIARARAGDAGAWDELLAPYQDGIYNAIRARVHDDEVAQEVLVEVLAEAYGALRSFEGRSSLPTWLHKITVRTCGRATRREPRRGAVALPEDLPDPEGDVAALVESRMQAEAVRDAIRSLPEKLRAAVSLRYLGHHSYQEIADILGIPVGTVRSRLSAGMKRMEHMLPELDQR